MRLYHSKLFCNPTPLIWAAKIRVINERFIHVGSGAYSESIAIKDHHNIDGVGVGDYVTLRRHDKGNDLVLGFVPAKEFESKWELVGNECKFSELVRSV